MARLRGKLVPLLRGRIAAHEIGRDCVGEARLLSDVEPRTGLSCGCRKGNKTFRCDSNFDDSGAVQRSSLSVVWHSTLQYHTPVIVGQAVHVSFCKFQELFKIRNTNTKHFGFGSQS